MQQLDTFPKPTVLKSDRTAISCDTFLLMLCLLSVEGLEEGLEQGLEEGGYGYYMIAICLPFAGHVLHVRVENGM